MTATVLASAGSARADDGSHTDLTVGAGVLTAGLGVGFGHRFGSGVRAEAAVGTLLTMAGYSAGAGYSLRLRDGPGATLELPLLAYWLEVHGPPLERSGVDGASIGGVTAGIDWLQGKRSSTRPGVCVSLRLGPAWDDEGAAILLWQANAGLSF